MTRFILIDIEADMRGNGTPFSTRMSEFGCVDLESGAEFEGLLWPAEPWPEKPALSYIPDGAEPFDRRRVFTKFEKWLGNWDDRIVAVSDNNGYDLMYFNVTWDEVMGTRSPFGHSSRNICDLAAGAKMATGDTWKNRQWWKRLSDLPHTHRAVEDSRANADRMKNMLKMFDQKI